MMTSKEQDGDRQLFLVEWAHIHTDFQLSEVASVLDMEHLVEHCIVHPLPRQNFEPCSFCDFYAKLRQTTNNEEIDTHRSFLIISLPIQLDNQSSSEKLITALSRCALVRGVIELWAADEELDLCAQKIRNMVQPQEGSQSENNLHHPLIQKHCMAANMSWKMTIATLGSKYTREEQNEMRLKFSNHLPFAGPVLMDEPTNEFVLIREIELDHKGSPLYPRHASKSEIIPENDARPPLAVYFGRTLGSGRNLREEWEKFKLKNRVYLGPTSMDSELSMVMTNLAQVCQGSLCFDPFVGTGSILLTCALRGGFCFGTDIDIRVLRGKNQDENILANFRQFNLPRPEIVRSDNSLYNRHYRSDLPMNFDAIVCDPPYGIRAGARQSGSRLEEVKPVLEEHRHDHIPQTKPYPVSDVMADLLDVAAQVLHVYGRLVYIIPSMNDFEVNTDLPRHPCLKLVHCCYQPLQMHLGRRVVAMEKIKEYDESQRESYKSSAWVNGPESAEKVANIRERIIEEARKIPGYVEKCAYRAKKRKIKKEENKRQKVNNSRSHDSGQD